MKSPIAELNTELLKRPTPERLLDIKIFWNCSTTAYGTVAKELFAEIDALNYLLITKGVFTHKKCREIREDLLTEIEELKNNIRKLNRRLRKNKKKYKN